jgi:hypothetical protein
MRDGRNRDLVLVLVLVVGGETEMTFFLFGSSVETLQRVKDNYADPTEIA